MRWSVLPLCLALGAGLLDAREDDARARARNATSARALRGALPGVVSYELASAAFPEQAGAAVAVHVPPGFDPTRRPGLVVYFHGWQGCVAAALADDDVPCREGGELRTGARLATQVDEADVNAMLVAIELRPDEATGEPGRMAMPGGLRALLHELFAERLAGRLGFELQIPGLDRVVVIAHSGGYQAAAGVLELGDVPEITEVVLLDALYGADDVFAAWVGGAIAGYDPRLRGPRRFVDLYTCCGGTLDRSRALAARAHDEAARASSWPDVFYDDDGAGDLEAGALAHAIVFKRVPRGHAELPRTYVRDLVEAAGFARIGPPSRARSAVAGHD